MDDCGSGNNQINSWVTSNNSFLSTDGGAIWSANGADQKHLIVNLGNRWTGSKELSLRVYHKALNHSGLMTPSRLIKEGDYYYSIGFEIHRDFNQLNTATDEAPIDKYGYTLLRTKDITNPKGWQAWASGSTFHAVTRGDFGAFLPVLDGSTLNGSQVQMVFDLKSARSARAGGAESLQHCFHTRQLRLDSRYELAWNEFRVHEWSALVALGREPCKVWRRQSRPRPVPRKTRRQIQIGAEDARRLVLATIRTNASGTMLMPTKMIDIMI